MIQREKIFDLLSDEASKSIDNVAKIAKENELDVNDALKMFSTLYATAEKMIGLEVDKDVFTELSTISYNVIDDIVKVAKAHNISVATAIKTFSIIFQTGVETSTIEFHRTEGEKCQKEITNIWKE